MSRVRKKDRTGRKRASKNVTALVGLPGPEPRRGCALFGVGTLRNLVMICHVKGTLPYFPIDRTPLLFVWISFKGEGY